MPMRTNTSMTTAASIITTETSTTSKGAVAADLPPPPGMTTLSTATSTTHHSNSNNSSMTNGTAGFIRRVSSVDDEHMHSGGGVRYHMFRDALHHHPNGNDNNIHNNIIRPGSTTSAVSAPTQPWREDIFRSTTSYGRGGGEEKQSRNESSQRADRLLRSHDSDPLTSSSSLLFLQQSGMIGASNRPLLDDESSLDEMRASCPNNQDRPLEVYGRASDAIAATAGGSFDHNDNPASALNTGSTNIFRSHPKQRLYSPVIGTPTRNSMVGRKRLDTDWTMFRANSNDHLFSSGVGDHSSTSNDAGALSSSSWIPSIRPSLSCPTSVFESPLFSSSLNSLGGGSHHSLFGIGGGGGGSSSSSVGGTGGGRGSSMGADTILLSQPYRLEKIESISADASPAHALLDNSGNFLGDDDKCDDDDEVNTSADKDRLAKGNELENVDVSVIECEDDEDSPFRNAAKSTMTSTSTTTNHLSHHAHSLADHNNNSMVGGDNPRLVENPMRNLSDAFESLVVDNNSNYNYSGGNYVHGNHLIMSDPDNLSARMQNQFIDLSSRVGASASISSLPQQSQISETTSGASINNTTTTSLAEALSKNGETGSSTKPSPTSIFSFDNETIPNPSTHQFANGLTVVSISMPRFHLHEKLRGNLRQGLIDRVSFYSIVRDINKEALDAAMTDPKGGIYNDGTVHGKLRQMKRMGDNQSDNAGGNAVTDGSLKRVEDAAAAVHDTMSKNPSPPTIANGTHQVIAEDGKIHLHPNPQEERESLLVMACLPDEQGVEEDRCPTSTASNAPKTVSPSLGAALLDEEWWLMSAIASRAPEEVALNQSTQLLATFYEAMGEKESSANATDGNNTAGASSRTQLWKPGRSWWEAKSGKNPWVEPVVHNNRWR